MKRSGLSAICMTFATDYQPGDAYDRFHLLKLRLFLFWLFLRWWL